MIHLKHPGGRFSLGLCLSQASLVATTRNALVPIHAREWNLEGRVIMCCILASQLPGLQMLRRGTPVRAPRGQNHTWRVTPLACVSKFWELCLGFCILFSLWSVLFAPCPRPNSIWLLNFETQESYLPRREREFTWLTLGQAPSQVATSSQGTFVLFGKGIIFPGGCSPEPAHTLRLHLHPLIPFLMQCTTQITVHGNPAPADSGPISCDWDEGWHNHMVSP